jgi:hypothetical protein
MAVNNVFTLAPLQVDLNTGTDYIIDQITNMNWSAGIQEYIDQSDGSVDPSFVSGMLQDSRITATSTAIGRVLDSFDLSGASFGASDTVDLLFQKIASGGTRTGGSTEVSLGFATAMAIPRTVTANQGAEATANFEIIPWSATGSATTTSYSASATKTANTNAEQYFTLGPVSINGTTLTGVQSLTVDFGITEMVLSGDGDGWPTFVAIRRRDPRITVQCYDLSAAHTLIGQSGTAQTATDSVFYLRKLQAGGVARVSNATEEHISIAVDDGMVYIDSTDGSHGSEAMGSITIVPVYDGTNSILAIDTSAAIA